MKQYTMGYQSPLGPITLAGDDAGLTGLWFDGQKYYAETLCPDHGEKELPALLAAARWLDVYFAGRNPGTLPPLHLEGTPFRMTVWEIMLQIPYGGRMTYGEIAAEAARRMGRASMSAQAVGSAVGRNPISILVPCHRVVGTGGSLTGYAGGLDRKLALLKLEGADLSGLYRPRHTTAP